MFKFHTRLAKPISYGGKRDLEDIENIVIHYTGNKADTAKNNADYFATGNTRQAGAHYFVDKKGEIWKSINMNRIAWAVGGKYSLTNGAGAYYGECTNANSISIELCDCCVDTNWKQKLATRQLVQYIQKKCPNAKTIIRHWEVNGKSCLPLDCTELLTKNGWKELGEISIGEKVIQYNAETDLLEYAKVENIVEPRESVVYKCRNLEATKDHRMLTKPNSKKSKFYKVRSWGDILDGKKGHIIKTNGHKKNKGLDLSDDEIRYLVWVQADGHYMKSSSGKKITGIEFHIKKERKVKRILEILNSLQISYKETRQSNGSTKIRIYNVSEYEWCEKYLKDKCFTYKFLKMTDRQFNIFWNEVLMADGCVNANSYCSSIEKNLDIMQAICATHGKRTNICQTGISRSMIMTETNYIVGCGNRDSKKAISSRQTMVSCVTVPSGFILIRQNGKTFIVGNCPAPMIGTDNEKWLFFYRFITKGYQFDAKVTKKAVIRSSPKVASNKIRMVQRGTKVKIMELQGNWGRLKRKTSDEKDQWISLSKIEEI